MTHFSNIFRRGFAHNVCYLCSLCTQCKSLRKLSLAFSLHNWCNLLNTTATENEALRVIKAHIVTHTGKMWGEDDRDKGLVGSLIYATANEAWQWQHEISLLLSLVRLGESKTNDWAHSLDFFGSLCTHQAYILWRQFTWRISTGVLPPISNSTHLSRLIQWFIFTQIIFWPSWSFVP